MKTDIDIDTSAVFEYMRYTIDMHHNTIIRCITQPQYKQAKRDAGFTQES